jgi:hypothetical protein
MIDPPYRLEERPPTRVLVGGIGLPWLRDLDFGTQFLKRIDDVEWPEGVVLEDLSYSAHRVLHIRRYKLDLTPPDDEEVADRLGEAVGGIIDLDHTLAVVRYWKGFPEDTVVIEVEPGDRAFGLGFSDEVESVVDTVLEMIQEEVAAVMDVGGQEAVESGTREAPR